MVVNNLNQEALTLAKNIAHKVWQHAVLEACEIKSNQEYNQTIPTDVPSNIELLYGQFSTTRDKEYFLELALKSEDKHAKKLIEWISHYQQQTSLL